MYVAELTAADIRLRGVLDYRERRRLDRIRAEADRARFLLGAALLRVVAGGLLEIPPSSVPVDRTCADCGRWHGRPELLGTDLDCSVTHSGSVVAVAVTASGRIGVDVERVTDDRPEPALLDWTAGEARLKAGGSPGLSCHRLPSPRPGYVLTVATDRPAARVEVLDAAGLLRGAVHVIRQDARPNRTDRS